MDASTGTLRVRGLIANPKPRVLSPGLFMRIRLPVGEPHKMVLVPEQALSPDQGKKIVYVVNDRDQVVYRQVTLGPLYDGMRSITDGVKEGERIIISGIQRVRPGLVVKPQMLGEDNAREVKTAAADGKPAANANAREAVPKAKSEGTAPKDSTLTSVSPGPKAVGASPAH